MADKSSVIILEALGRAAADPHGLPLHGRKNTTYLFAATPSGKLAAQRCKNDGLLHAIRTETKGKTATEICAITEKGLAFLLAQVSPKRVLEDFIRTLEARKGQIDQLLDTTRGIQANLDALKAAAEKVLAHVTAPAPVNRGPSQNGSEDWLSTVIARLIQWHKSGQPEDCALPELYQRAKQAAPHLTVGEFHDGIRKLHEEERIYLHPWTGPLHELPQPVFALLIGHEIAYYASVRTVASGQWLVASEVQSSLATDH